MRHYMKMLAALFTIWQCSAHGQEGLTKDGDHLFPAQSGGMVTLATGIPYVGIVEYAFGFSDRFSVGVIAGVTPNVTGYGVRLRGILLQADETFRLYIRAPILYYPQTKELGGEPWILTWPVVSGEWKLNSGTRISLGGGVVVAACMHSLLGHKESGEGFMGGTWNTVHAGVAAPLSTSVMFHAEVSAVMSGIKLAGKDWVGGPPVILVVGFSYTL